MKKDITANDYFTEKEFNAIRSQILDLFKDDLKIFTVSKSTYKWSKEHNWIIHVGTSSNWIAAKKLSPADKLKKITLLFNTMQNFIENNENNFYFITINSRANFGYDFTFQLVVARAKVLLTF